MTRGVKRIQFADDRNMWDKQDGQSAKHHGYLIEYLKLGRGRTLTELQQNLTPQRTYDWIRQLSSAHRWNDIARAYDAEEDRKWAAKMEAERRKAASTRLAISKYAINLVAKAFSDHITPADITPAAAVQLITAADRIQRGIFGETDTRMEVTGPEGGPVELADFADLPDAVKAERARAILARTEKRAQLISDYYSEHTGDEQ